jgi:hypothetical protein
VNLPIPARLGCGLALLAFGFAAFLLHSLARLRRGRAVTGSRLARHEGHQ